MMSYVKWTPGEWKGLSVRWKELREQGLRPKEALNTAQVQLLSEERRRKVYDAAPVYEKFCILAGRPDIQAPKGVEQEITELRGKLAQLESELRTLQAIVYGNGAKAKHDPLPKSDTFRKPRIAIVGISPNQVPEIRHYEQLFELRYFEPGSHKLEWCAHAQRVIMMGTHVTHAQHVALKRMGVQLLYNMSGAVSGLSSLLEGLKERLNA